MLTSFSSFAKNCITAHSDTMLQTDFKYETCFGKGKLSSYRKIILRIPIDQWLECKLQL